MLKVDFVFNDIKDKERIEGSLDSSIFTFIDSDTKKGKRDAFMLKGHWAARLEPFAVVYNDEIPIKCFYSEADNVISDLITFIKNYEDSSYR